MQLTVGKCAGLYDAHADSLYICYTAGGSKVVCGTHVCAAWAATRDCCNIDSTAAVELAQGWRICGTRHSLLFLVLFLLPDQRLYIVNNICILVHIYIYCVQTVYELPLLPNDTAVKHFYTVRSGAKCWLDSYRWGAGLAVPGQIHVRNVGQNVLQSSFETGSSSGPVTATFCCLSHSSRRPLLEIQ